LNFTDAVVGMMDVVTLINSNKLLLIPAISKQKIQTESTSYTIHPKKSN